MTCRSPLPPFLRPVLRFCIQGEHKTTCPKKLEICYKGLFKNSSNTFVVSLQSKSYLTDRSIKVVEFDSTLTHTIMGVLYFVHSRCKIGDSVSTGSLTKSFKADSVIYLQFGPCWLCCLSCLSYLTTLVAVLRTHFSTLPSILKQEVILLHVLGYSLDKSISDALSSQTLTFIFQYQSSRTWQSSILHCVTLICQVVNSFVVPNFMVARIVVHLRLVCF